MAGGGRNPYASDLETLFFPRLPHPDTLPARKVEGMSFFCSWGTDASVKLGGWQMGNQIILDMCGLGWGGFWVLRGMEVTATTDARLQIYKHCGSWCEIMAAADKRLLLVENSKPGVGEVDESLPYFTRNSPLFSSTVKCYLQCIYHTSNEW